MGWGWIVACSAFRLRESLLPCGFSTSTFVKGSRRRLPIKLRVLITARLSLSLSLSLSLTLSTRAGANFTLVIQPLVTPAKRRLNLNPN